MELKLTFDRLADAILTFGTTAVRKELTEIAAQVRDEQPGAAAALIDWEGSEIARERAFAVIRNQQVREEASYRLHAIQAAPTVHRSVA
jgi:hypothetical protein